MLIVKILPAKSSSFNGVAYNEGKIDKEKSNLLKAENFIGLDEKANKKDYITYLQKHSEKNSRVTKPQFHVAVSGKGKETSFAELEKFGQHYMEQMGYGSNPYLMYKHTDTDNNHIHIVSSRVDKEGNKIPDNYERVRSQKIINKYFGLDIQKEIEAKLNKLSKYNISNVAQYKLLLEKEFKKVIEQKEYISVYSSEKKIDIKKEEINKLISTSFKPKFKSYHKKRKAEIKSALTELSKEYRLEEVKIIARNHNIELEIFKTKDGLKNFGYTVIDKNSKSVFKGSEIMPLKRLETNHSVEKEKLALVKFLEEIKTPKMSLDAVNEILAETGRTLKSNGAVTKVDNDKEVELFKIPKSKVYPFNYNSVLSDIENNYKPLNSNDSRILSYLFKVKMNDITLPEGASLRKEEEYRKELSLSYNSVLKYFQNNNYDFKEQLEDSKLQLFKLNNNFYVIDEKEKFIGNIELDNDVKMKLEAEKLYKKLGENKEFEKQPLRPLSFAQILDNVAYMFHYEDENNRDKKKKRSIKRSR